MYASNINNINQMTESQIKFTRVREVKLPQRGTPQSAGIDFYVPEDFEARTILAHQDVKIPSGIHVKLPKNKVLIFMDKSGISTKLKLIIGAKVVDEDYQGEIHIHVINVGYSPVEIKPGMKLVQGLILDTQYFDIEEVTSLEDLYPEATERGSGGFGSTGI